MKQQAYNKGSSIQQTTSMKHILRVSDCGPWKWTEAIKLVQLHIQTQTEHVHISLPLSLVGADNSQVSLSLSLSLSLSNWTDSVHISCISAL